MVCHRTPRHHCHVNSNKHVIPDIEPMLHWARFANNNFVVPLKTPDWLSIVVAQQMITATRKKFTSMCVLFALKNLFMSAACLPLATRKDIEWETKEWSETTIQVNKQSKFHYLDFFLDCSAGSFNVCVWNLFAIWWVCLQQQLREAWMWNPNIHIRKERLWVTDGKRRMLVVEKRGDEEKKVNFPFHSVLLSCLKNECFSCWADRREETSQFS